MQKPSGKVPAQGRDFWKSVEKMARQVDNWPKWMKGGEGRRTDTLPETPQSQTGGGKELPNRQGR